MKKVSEKTLTRLKWGWTFLLFVGTLISLVLLTMKYMDAQKNPITVIKVDKKKILAFPSITICHQSPGVQLTSFGATHVSDATGGIVDLVVENVAEPAGPLDDDGTDPGISDETISVLSERYAGFKALRASQRPKRARVSTRSQNLRTTWAGAVARHFGTAKGRTYRETVMRKGTSGRHLLQDPPPPIAPTAVACVRLKNSTGADIFAQARDDTIALTVFLHPEQVKENGVIGVEISMQKKGETEVSYSMASGQATLLQLAQTENIDIKEKKKTAWQAIPSTTQFKTSSTDVREGLATIVFSYQTLDVIQIQETVEYDFMSFFGEFGGWAGVLLGVSFIQVVDIFSQKDEDDEDGKDGSKVAPAASSSPDSKADQGDTGSTVPPGNLPPLEGKS